MAYDGKVLAAARERLEAQRARNRQEQQRRTDLVYRRIPEIEQLDRTLRSQMTQVVRLTLSHTPALQEKLAALKEDNLNLQMRKAELLVEYGYPMEYLDEIIDCPDCRDTGIYRGGVCKCLERLYNEELTGRLSTLLRTGDESFDNFSFEYYSPAYDAASGCTPRESMKVVYDICRKFADSFPAFSSHLLLQGKPGLGRTYLSACIAREAAAKGYAVCYESAASAFGVFEAQKFARDPEEAAQADATAKRMLDCDLMILDDLGTEMITSVSQSAFYTLLNTRIINRRPMIISTNLTDPELERKYTQQICSRLSGEFMHLPFAGSDIRRQKKKF